MYADIPQFDGNVSVQSLLSLLSSSNSLDSSILHHINDNGGEIYSIESKIQVIIGNRPLQSISHVNINHQRVLKTIRRDNKAVQGLSPPVISNYNMRFIFPKINSFAEDFFEREIGLPFLSEIWEKSSNKKHQHKLQELFELKGIIYISGVAIAADPSRFSLSKLNISIPHQLEVSWGLLKPRQATGSITKIIC